jgi:hypothetical protein
MNRATAASGQKRIKMALAETLDAQQLYRQMMTGIVAPALRKLGMSGSVHMMRLVSGSYSASLWPQKSRHNTKEEVEFWFHAAAFYQPEGHEAAGYWHYELRWLNYHLPISWTVKVGAPVEPVAEDVIAAVRDVGLPAMLAAIDSPGFPPDPDARWARTFPAAEPGQSDREGAPPGWRLPPVERMLALLASSDPIDRFSGIGTIGESASDDPRVLPALLDRLEHDLDQRVRRTAALNLRWSTAHDVVREALQATASDDEDLEVRWAARYILRLADIASSAQAYPLPMPTTE